MTTENKPVQFARLDAAVYKTLEAQCRAPTATATTTPIEAGYLLGVQHVLKLLREGWVIGS